MALNVSYDRNRRVDEWGRLLYMTEIAGLLRVESLTPHGGRKHCHQHRPSEAPHHPTQFTATRPDLRRYNLYFVSDLIPVLAFLHYSLFTIH